MRRPLRRLALACAAAALWGPAAGAQTTLVPAPVPDVWAVAGGAGRDAETGAWVPRLASDGRLPLAGWGRMELDATGEGAALVPLDGRAAARALGGLRLTLAGEAGALWMGTAGGGASNVEGERALWVAEAGGRWRWRRTGLMLSVRQTHLAGIPGTWADSAITGPDTFPVRTIRVRVTPDVPSRRYTDAELGLEFARGPLRIAASAGGRLADLHLRAESWVRAGADLRLNPRTSLSLAAGRVAGVPELGSPSAPFVRFALRLTPPGRAPAAAPLVLAPPADVAQAFEVRSAGERRTLRVRIPGAARVELKGDFTEWEPLALTPGDEPGTWEAVLSAAPGTYRLNVRVDGGEWSAPPGLLDVPDEFGGRVGLLVLG
ncbi:MAG TPA: glycogen-binding domain-containing protein [Longimicrobium sp.]|nr:glycogen-binding domain-containing protein [Longimicrobium sp.]